MKAKLKKQRQDEQRRMNQAYRELVHAGGYIDRAVKLVSLQYLVGSMVEFAYYRKEFKEWVKAKKRHPKCES